MWLYILLVCLLMCVGGDVAVYIVIVLVDVCWW
jgi:hypothetical protein